MSTEKFSQLPSAFNATLSDVICAVQAGISVQETLQQVFNLMLGQTVLSHAGNPNTHVAGTVYQLCWDTVDNVLWVCTTSGSTSGAVWKSAVGTPLLGVTGTDNFVGSLEPTIFSATLSGTTIVAGNINVNTSGTDTTSIGNSTSTTLINGSITLNANGSNDTDIATGTNNGTITIGSSTNTTDLNSPITNTHGIKLNGGTELSSYVENTTFTTDFTGLGFTLTAVPISFVKIGNTVTANIGISGGTYFQNQGNSGVLTNSTMIPTAFRPSVTQGSVSTGAMIVDENFFVSNTAGFAGALTISNNGQLTISYGAISGFSGSGNGGFVAFSASWNTL